MVRHFRVKLGYFSLKALDWLPLGLELKLRIKTRLRILGFKDQSQNVYGLY